MPEYPLSARNLGLGPVTVLVETTIGPTGNLIAATIYKSSGSIAIDRAALLAARQSVYAPKFVNCVPTTGDYLYRAEFSPGSLGPPPTPVPGVPSFVAPSGWIGSFYPGGPNGAWHDAGFRFLSLTWAYDARTLSQYQDDAAANARLRPNAGKLATERIKVCNGTQDGLHFSYAAATSAMRNDQYVVVKNGILYTLTYRANDGAAPSPELETAISNFCAP